MGSSSQCAERQGDALPMVDTKPLSLSDTDAAVHDHLFLRWLDVDRAWHVLRRWPVQSMPLKLRPAWAIVGIDTRMPVVTVVMAATSHLRMRRFMIHLPCLVGVG
jgi:hypothetical protein